MRSASSSLNIVEYKFLTGKDVLPEKYLLEKAAKIKIFKYLLLGREKKQHHGLDNKTREVFCVS